MNAISDRAQQLNRAGAAAVPPPAVTVPPPPPVPRACPTVHDVRCTGGWCAHCGTPHGWLAPEPFTEDDVALVDETIDAWFSNMMLDCWPDFEPAARLVLVALAGVGRLLPTEPEVVVVTREELTGHIDDPVCTCVRCHPEWHTGVRCNCLHCLAIRGGRMWRDG